VTDTDLTGRRVLALVTNYGVEQDELVVPVERLRAQGATVTVAASTTGPVQTLVGDKDPGRTVPVDITSEQAAGQEFDLLLIPGGTINADTLRLQGDAVDIVRTFTTSGRPVAAICHGPWALVEAGATQGKTLTSYPSLCTDLKNAGATWVDRSVVVDDAHGYRLVTSRNPGDLDDFVAAVTEALGAPVSASS